jgi:antirestriction protein ArdC
MPSQNEIRESITADLIALLKKGTKPWQKPWSSDPNCTGLPRSISTGKAYSGINVLVLQASALARGYSSPIWGTYQAFAKAGGQVRRRPSDVPSGRWATTAIYFNQVERKTTDDEGQTKIERWPLMRVFSLFNLDQVDGAALDHLRPGRADAAEVVPDYAHAEEVFQATKAEVRFGGDRAFYKRPTGGEWPNHAGGDYIQMPLRKQFHTPADYVTTLAHELCHWSECRLGWKGSYSLGELIAEVGACYLAGHLGLPIGEHLESHAAYLACWLKELESDNKAIFKAAAQASKTADLILSFSRQEEVEPEPVEVGQEG